MGLDLTLDAVQAFLAGRLGQPVSDLSAVGHGEWSRAFTFGHAAGEYVARFSQHLDHFLKDRRAMAFASTALPVPRLIEIGEALGAFYAISERAHGAFIETLEADAMRRVLPSLFAALDTAREADLADSSGFGVWRGQDGNAPHVTWRAALLDIGVDRQSNRTHGWRARLESSPIGSAVFDQTLRRLEARVDGCPETRHLVHSDLLYYNVLAADDRISAVLDWGSSLYGDFVFDIAWFTFWQPWYPAWRPIDFAAEARRHYSSIGLDVPAFVERLRACELYIALDGMAYQAFKGRWADLEATTKRTLELDYPG